MSTAVTPIEGTKMVVEIKEVAVLLLILTGYQCLAEITLAGPELAANSILSGLLASGGSSVLNRMPSIG